MRGRLWLHYFVRAMARQKPAKKDLGSREWTEYLGKIMDEVGDIMNCRIARRRLKDTKHSGEYLNIDAVFIDNAEYALVSEKTKWDPFVLPRAIVELENQFSFDKISYDLWKLMCVRSPIRALICLLRKGYKLESLKLKLEKVLWQGSLTKGADGDLYVIIGDDSVKGDAPWRDYFSVYEWRNDRLEKIEGLDW